MTIPERRTSASLDPRWQIQITDDGSPTLIDSVSGDSMHSGCGAIAETKHVYLRNSGVTQRLQDRSATRVLEIGLGSGLGFLMSADLANRCHTRLQYVAIENKLVSADVVRQLHLERHEIAIDIVTGYCNLLQHSAGQTTLHGTVGEHNELTVYQCEAQIWRSEDETPFDAVYFDPYSPQSNPELWSQQVLTVMHRCLKPGGRLVSYCVNRKVRDLMAEVGFQVNRVPGPDGGKREVLVATK